MEGTGDGRNLLLRISIELIDHVCCAQKPHGGNILPASICLVAIRVCEYLDVRHDGDPFEYELVDHVDVVAARCDGCFLDLIDTPSATHASISTIAHTHLMR